MKRRIASVMEGLTVGFMLGFVLGASIASSDMVIDKEPIEHSQRPAVSSTWAARGVATWYGYIPGQAAAGPELRALIGPDWRGSAVRVSSADSGKAVIVRLTDWCACGDRDGKPTLIDLDVADFTFLAGSAGVGVAEVIVQPVPAPPDTSTED